MEVAEIIKQAGGVSKIAHAVGRHHTSVMGWKRVPVEHARVISDLTQIPLHVIRPDVWDAPAATQATEAA